MLNRNGMHLLAAALAFLPAILSPQAVRGQTMLIERLPVWEHENTWALRYYGAVVSTAGDINGDGYSDILVGAPALEDWSSEFDVYLSSPSGIDVDSHYRVVGGDGHIGTSVSCAGDVNGDGYDDIVVGWPEWISADDLGGQTLVYYGSRSGLTHSRKTGLTMGQARAQFGHSVSRAGDVNGDGYDDIIVGAPWFDAGKADEGVAFVFTGSGAGIGTTPAWMAQTNLTDDHLGYSVACAGDVNGDGYDDVVIGVPHSDAGAEDGGAVVVYLGSAGGLSVDPDWVFNGDAAGMQLGLVVATAGDVNGDGYSDVLVGAPEYDTEELSPPDGRVYLFFGSPAGVVTESRRILAHDRQGRFGWSLASAGDINGDGYDEILVGARYDFSNHTKDAAFVVAGSPDGPDIERAQIILAFKPPDLQGHAVAMGVASAGDVNGDGYSDVIIGNAGAGTMFHGRASVYLGIPEPGALAPDPLWTASGEAAHGRFGTSMAAGDWNGDGWIDIATGAPLEDVEAENAGAAYVYVGGNGGTSTSPGWRGAGAQTGEWFGYALTCAGDIDGDGYADLAVGAPHYSRGDRDEGAVYFFAGSGEGPGSEAVWMVEGNHEGAGFGYAAARAGDVNGDGYSDVIVGAFRYGDGEPEEGAARVFYGSRHGPFDAHSWSAEGAQVGAWFGYSVAGAGDVNADGYDDVVIGAPHYDFGVDGDEGAAFVYLGSDTGLATQPAVVVSAGVSGSMFGLDVAGAGDVNSDGRADVAVGTGGKRLSLDETGFAFVFAGGGAGVEETPMWAATGGAVLGGLGRTVAGVGDVDGDGYGDLLIGDPLFDNDFIDAGRVLLFRGSGIGPSTVPDWIVEGDSPGVQLGHTLAAVGDIDGDGHYDVGAGAPRHTADSLATGAVFVYGTSAEDMPVVNATQVRGDLSTIGLMGSAEDNETFGMRVRLRLPTGANEARLQWQAADPQTPFGATATVSGRKVFRRPAGGSGPVLGELVETIDPPQSPGYVRWRVRVVTDLPARPLTRWYYHSANPSGGASLRFGFTPDLPPPPPPPPPPPEPEPIRHKLSVGEVYPNPFNPTVSVNFTLPGPGTVDIVIYDVAGRRVRGLFTGAQNAGPHTLPWNGDDDAGRQAVSGIYFVRLVYGGETFVRKMVLVR